MTIHTGNIHPATGILQPITGISRISACQTGNKPGYDGSERPQIYRMPNARGKIDLERLDRRLEIVGLSAFEASKRATGSADVIRDLKRSKSGTLRVKTLYALADVLECDPDYLTGEQDEPRKARPEVDRAPLASFELSPNEIRMIGLMRNAPGEVDRLIMIAETLVAENLRSVDDRGRKVKGRREA